MANPNPYADVYAAFVKNTPDHELTVIHEDGLYRHLRMAKPGTRIWSWDIITWPGYLCVVGDIANGFTFNRLEDMFQFFSSPGNRPSRHTDGAPHIDARYWAEKLTGGRSHEVKEYSRSTFLQLVEERIAEALEDNTVDPEDAEKFGETPDPDGMTEAKAAALREDARFCSGDEDTAHGWMRRSRDFPSTDSWELDLRDFSFEFMLTCYAIESAVRTYIEHNAAVPAELTRTSQRRGIIRRMRAKWGSRELFGSQKAHQNRTGIVLRDR